MNVKTILAIGFLLLVAASIEMVLKDLTEVPPATQSRGGCGCITLTQAAPKMHDDFAPVDPMLVPGETNNGQWVAWCNIATARERGGDSTAHSGDVQEGVRSYFTEGSQQ